jgi:hypothetical protein
MKRCRIRQRVEAGDRAADAVHAVVEEYAYGARSPAHDLVDGAAATGFSAQRNVLPKCPG